MVKAKKKNLSEITQHKRIQDSKKKLNPFEIHINKNKQNILGQKNKNDRGLPGISRAKAINKRKQSLLQEYKLKNKDNVFLDKRIGEKNSAMSMEDKAMARFAMERMKTHKKKSIYNLNDDEILTHRGQTLEEIEKFDDPKSDDESDDENAKGTLDRNFVEEAHFGGGILSKSDSTLSRKDLINQLIAESKKRKAEKQKIRDQVIDLTEKLDSDWKDLLPIISASKKTADDDIKKTKADDYDIAMRQLMFEARGKPSDKLKSEEQIAQEEKEKLEALEADRLARMKGFVSDNSNQTKHRSADDLDDGFLVETVGENDDNNVNITANDIDNEKGSDDDDDNDNDNDNNANADADAAAAAADDDDDNDSDDDDDDNDDDDDDDDDDADADDDNDNDNNKLSNKKKSMKETETRNNNKDKETICFGLSNKDKDKDKSDAISNSDKYSGNENSDDETSEDNFSDLKQSETSSEDENETVQKHVTFTSDMTKHSKQTTQLNQDSLKSILKQNNDVAHIQDSSNKNRKDEIINDLLKRKEIMEVARSELPYTYNMPENFEELEKLLENHDAKSQSVIIDRIITCNHWTLNGKNKEKLSDLFIYLLQYINNCADSDNVHDLIKFFQIFDR